MKRFTACLLCLFLCLAVVTAEVTSISLSRDHLSNTDPDRNITVTVNGTGFKSLKALHIQTSLNGKTQAPVQCSINSIGTVGTATIKVPVSAEVPSSGLTYVVKVIENFTSISSINTSFKVTPPATVSSVSVDLIDDTLLNVTVKGRNLDIRGETYISIVDTDGVECMESRTTVPAPASVEEEPVIRPSYEIGDLVFSDGSIVNPADYNRRRMGIPTGVIAYEMDGVPYMIGASCIMNGARGLEWCEYSANGYAMQSALVAKFDTDEADYATVTGHTDGSETWPYLENLSASQAENMDDYYPAFYYAETYGGANNLYGTSYESGWYVPSLWELVEIYKNRYTVNDSFSYFTSNDLGYRRYRSSSQTDGESSYSPGVNFDSGYIWTTYSSKDESDVYVMVVTPVFATTTSASKMFEVTVPVPADTGIFSVQVYIDGVLQNAKGHIQIAGEPEITRVVMPVVTSEFCGAEIPVVIYGKNFSVGSVTPSSFIVFGVEASEVRIISDTQASVNITYPDWMGDHEVTFVCESSLVTATLQIVDSVSSGWAPGDVILSDGSKVAKSDVSKMTPAQKSKAVAVIAFTKYGMQPYGMGLTQNESVYLMREYGYGYNNTLRDLIAERSNSWYADSDVVVTGDVTGYDNWAIIQSLDPSGAANMSYEYPGFYWAQEYGYNNNLPANCAEGWFVPSLSELVEIYKNRNAINQSLKALGRTELMRGWYSTSSQYPSDSDYIWRIDFSDGEIDSGYKDSSRYQLVIRQFGDMTAATSSTSVVPAATSASTSSLGVRKN